MAWWIDLSIGEKNWSWRKHIPVETSLLFYGKHKIIDEGINSSDIDSNEFIGFEATVGQVITNLDNLGLSLEFFISIYEMYRSNMISGFIIGYNRALSVLEELDGTDSNRGKELKEEYKVLIHKINNSVACDEVKCAVDILKKNLQIETNLLEDESLIPCILHIKNVKLIADDNILKASIFGCFLSSIDEDLPEIAWLFEVRLILESMSKRKKVKLNVRDWVTEIGTFDNIFDDIMDSSLDSMRLKAKVYAKTFDTILGGNETYNKEYERIRLTNKWNNLKSLEKYDISKGRKLEEFIGDVFHEKDGFEVLSKNLLTETQELDLVLKNTSTNHFIRSLNTPFILIECKNWSSPVGVAEARVFESKYREAGKKVNLGIFIALNGVTKPFKRHLNNLIRDGVNLIVIDDEKIHNYLYSEDLDIGIWLEKIISKQFILDFD